MWHCEGEGNRGASRINEHFLFHGSSFKTIVKTAAVGFDLWAGHRGSTYGLDKTDYGLRAGQCGCVVGWRLRGVFPLWWYSTAWRWVLHCGWLEASEGLSLVFGTRLGGGGGCTAVSRGHRVLFPVSWYSAGGRRGRLCGSGQWFLCLCLFGVGSWTVERHGGGLAWRDSGACLDFGAGAEGGPFGLGASRCAGGGALCWLLGLLVGSGELWWALVGSGGLW